jgi:hypothetical protein
MRWVAHFVRCRIESDVYLSLWWLYVKGLALLKTVEYVFTMLWGELRRAGLHHVEGHSWNASS